MRTIFSISYEPGESHLPHMAGHTFARVGDYDALVAANRIALDNDRAYLSGSGAGPEYMRAQGRAAPARRCRRLANRGRRTIFRPRDRQSAERQHRGVAPRAGPLTRTARRRLRAARGPRAAWSAQHDAGFLGAERVFRKELESFPRDPRLLFGLAEALKAQAKDDTGPRAAYLKAWQGAAKPLTLEDLG